MGNGLLYFVPTTRTVIKHSELVACGLGYAFDRQPDATAVTKGPDGVHGLICGYGSQFTGDRRIGYYPARQTWERLRIGDGLHVGFYTDAPPGPAELVRAEPLPGHVVTCADGNDYLVPVARQWSVVPDGEQGEKIAGWFNALPSRMTLDDDGEWTIGAVQAQYARLWEIATKWHDCYMRVNLEEVDEGEAVEFDLRGSADAAVEALAANYRLSRVEASLLGLFDSSVIYRVLAALIDAPTMQAFLKKKESAPDS